VTYRVPERTQYTVIARVLHWLTAILVFTALFIGFVMVTSTDDYARLLMIHKTLGITILLVSLVRIVNRLTHRAPGLPYSVGPVERKLVVLSELSMYALLVVQPLVGWAMVSASGRPIVVFGSVRIPPIAPISAELFAVLRQTHSLVAYALLAAVAAHISAVLLHTLTLRDGMLLRMAFRFRRSRPPGHLAREGVETQTDSGPGHCICRQDGDPGDGAIGPP
jgi:cytochrome b561